MPMLFTASSVRPQVMEANKDYMGRNVWRQAFGDISVGNQQATTQLSQEYGNAMNQAYLSSMANENAIRASNLGQGYKGLALEENERTLDDAFESYKANYLSGKEKIDTSSAAAVAEVNEAIDSQATNVAQYSNAMFEFLPDLYEKESKKDSNLFLTDPALKRFTNEDGTLMSEDELKSMMFNLDGSLNEIGTDYMNMVQNMGSSGRFGTNTFTNYLAEKNPALLQWLSSVNPYGSGETNGEMFNNILGTSGGEYIMSRESFTDDQFKSLQSDYTKIHDELIAQYNTGHKSEKDATEFMNKQKEANAALITLAENLGVAGNEEVKALIEKVESNTVKYDSAISDPGKGNNRLNREWATSNALADYEELYDAIMKAYDAQGFESSVFDNKYGDLSITDNDYFVAGATKPNDFESTLYENTLTVKFQGTKGKEHIKVKWDNSKPLEDVSNYKQVYSWPGSKQSLGYIGNDVVIKVGDEYFKVIEDEKDSAQRQLFNYIKEQK